jgi:hypothetical protein
MHRPGPPSSLDRQENAVLPPAVRQEIREFYLLDYLHLPFLSHPRSQARWGQRGAIVL